MINKTSIYLIKALAKMATLQKGAFIGVAELAKDINVPGNYLSKNFQILVHHGFLTSQKGKGGGFALNAKTRKMPLLKIISEVDDIERWSRCFLGRSECRNDRPCTLHDEWKRVRDNYLQFLESHTIENCL